MYNFRKRASVLQFMAATALVAASLVAADAATLSTVPMNNIPAGGPVGEGAVSTIVRDEQGVTITVHTKNLDPGPHTVWALVWNNPEECAGAGPLTCAPPPFGADPPDSVIRGNGTIVGASGKGNFGFRINVGDTSEVIGGAVRAGLTDALGAEIHAAIADHGEIIPGEIADQLRNPGDSGCGGPCPIVQGAVHAPGAPDAVGMQLDAIQELLQRVAVRNGLKP